MIAQLDQPEHLNRAGELVEAARRAGADAADAVAASLRDMFKALRAANDFRHRLAASAPMAAVEGIIVAGR